MRPSTNVASGIRLARTLSIGSGILAAALVVSCSHARVVNIEPGRGGTIALSSRTSSGARDKASRIMADNCPDGRYQITKEGEAVVGSRASAPIMATRTTGNIGVAVAPSSARHKTEWRLQYRCLTTAE